MKLEKYNIELIISDPDDLETNVSVSIERVPRQRILENSILASTLLAFEEAVE